MAKVALMGSGLSMAGVLFGRGTGGARDDSAASARSPRPARPRRNSQDGDKVGSELEIEELLEPTRGFTNDFK
eukprot:10862409-Alexandrium_andersonii.AAC.1